MNCHLQGAGRAGRMAMSFFSALCSPINYSRTNRAASVPTSTEVAIVIVLDTLNERQQ